MILKSVSFSQRFSLAFQFPFKAASVRLQFPCLCAVEMSCCFQWNQLSRARCCFHPSAGCCFLLLGDWGEGAWRIDFLSSCKALLECSANHPQKPHDSLLEESWELLLQNTLLRYTNFVWFHIKTLWCFYVSIVCFVHNRSIIVFYLPATYVDSLLPNYAPFIGFSFLNDPMNFMRVANITCKRLFTRAWAPS